MATDLQDTPLSARATGPVPRAVWVGGGLLGLVTAALAGALIMRSVEPTSTTVAAANPATAAPLTASVATQPMPTTALPPAKPEHHAKAVTAPATVAHPAWNPPGGTRTASTPGSACHCGRWGLPERRVVNPTVSFAARSKSDER